MSSCDLDRPRDDTWEINGPASAARVSERMHEADGLVAAASVGSSDEADRPIVVGEYAPVPVLADRLAHVGPVPWLDGVVGHGSWRCQAHSRRKIDDRQSVVEGEIDNRVRHYAVGGRRQRDRSPGSGVVRPCGNHLKDERPSGVLGPQAFGKRARNRGVRNGAVRRSTPVGSVAPFGFIQEEQEAVMDVVAEAGGDGCTLYCAVQCLLYCTASAEIGLAPLALATGVGSYVAFNQ